MREFKKQDFIPKSQQPPSLFINRRDYTLFEAMVELYHATLDVNNFQEVHLPPELVPWAQELYDHHGFRPSLVIGDKKLKAQSFPQREDEIIHLVTAGKDSSATALKHALGHFNQLVHVTGVNKIYPTEHRMCKALYQDQFEKKEPNLFKYHEIRAQFPRVTGASESPIKNMMITVMAIEYFQYLPKWVSIGGAEKIFDISETEVYGDTSKGLVPFFKALNVAYRSNLAITPYLRDQVEAYEICSKWGINGSDLASCMSQLRFKGKQRSMALDKYSRVVDGHTLLAGTTNKGSSIFDIPQATLDTLSLDDLANVDVVKPETDYRCIQGCFKCRERALVYSHHFGYHYHSEYIKKCKEGIISWMDKSPNNNRVNLQPYFTEVLGIPLDSIPDKYKLYMTGEAVRPDGWKEPKVKKK